MGGINWFIGDVTVGEVTFDTNGYSYVGNYDGELNGIISASAVPEPANFAGILALACLGMTVTHRRRVKAK